MAVVFDTHAWIKRLKEAGFTEEQAEAEVGLVREALAINLADLATKQDLRELELRLHARLKDIESGLEAKLKDTESGLEAKLKDTESRLEAKLMGETGKLDVRLTRLEADMVWTKRLAWTILGAVVVQLARSFGVL